MKSLRPIVLAVAVVVSACASSGAALDGAPAISGTWAGQIDFPDQRVDVTLQLGADGHGTMDMISRSLRQVAVSLRSNPTSTLFVVSSQNPPASFIGTRDGSEVSGTYHEAQKHYPFRLKRGG